MPGEHCRPPGSTFGTVCQARMNSLDFYWVFELAGSFWFLLAHLPKSRDAQSSGDLLQYGLTMVALDPRLG